MHGAERREGPPPSPRGHGTRSAARALMLGGLASLLLCRPVPADGPEPAPEDLTSLSLEELMAIEVTSVSKKPEELSEAPAAIYVITGEDIRRSGARSIAEVLRLVPGLQVARIDGNKWAISARGFNAQYVNKLLVLVDGRSVYSPLFSGVFWDVQDTLLEDIERIEVIRGPGGTLWGANAVNGVINIITKSARETQGLFAEDGGGSEEQGFLGARYGGRLGESAHYRVFGKFFDRDGLVDGSGHGTRDDWDQGRAGFRVDWDGDEADRLTLGGALYYGTYGTETTSPILTSPYSVRRDARGHVLGSHLLGRWTRRFSASSDMALQLYYDRTVRDDASLEETRGTFDVDFQHRFAPRAPHELLWGLNYRAYLDDVGRTATFRVDPAHRYNYLAGAFVQGTLHLVEDRLRLTAGSKFGFNDYTKFELQPSARILWTPSARHTIWGAVSRAVRTPSRVERGGEVSLFTIPPNPPATTMPTLWKLVGNRRFASENLHAFELGYRLRPDPRIFLDVAAFFHMYDELKSTEPGAPTFQATPVPHLEMPVRFDNELDGESFGTEFAASWKVADFWTLAGSFSFFKLLLHKSRRSSDVFAGNAETRSPRHQASLRSHLDLPENFEFDAYLYYVDSLRGFKVPSYLRLDLRLGWRPAEGIELGLVGQNLIDSHHEEFGWTGAATPTEAERGVYGMVGLRF